jgi:processing peptidase subunit beta
VRECLLNVPETKVTSLDNGFRVASEDSGLPTATVCFDTISRPQFLIMAVCRSACGSTQAVGTRMTRITALHTSWSTWPSRLAQCSSISFDSLLQGTGKRSQTQLELEVENMGAHLNAYTSREQTVYYARCFSNDVERGTYFRFMYSQNFSNS